MKPTKRRGPRLRFSRREVENGAAPAQDRERRKADYTLPFHDSIPRAFIWRRRVLLEAIAPGPPPDAGERFFHADLSRFSLEELHEERWRLLTVQRLTPRAERDSWPALWRAERLQHLEQLLRADKIAVGWERLRR